MWAEGRIFQVQTLRRVNISLVRFENPQKWSKKNEVNEER